MWQDAGALPDPQCTKDKCKLAFSCSRVKSPGRLQEGDSKGKRLSSVSAENPGSKALIAPRTEFSFDSVSAREVH